MLMARCDTCRRVLPRPQNVTGTGLTHLGSAAGRDKMHSGGEDKSAQANLTDSMKMFNMVSCALRALCVPCVPRASLRSHARVFVCGVGPGRRQAEKGHGVQPEWFYKGDGSVVVKPGGSFLSPKFALDGSEEPECVGLYVI